MGKQHQAWRQHQYVRNISDTYSCVIKKLSPAINVKAPAATKQTSAITKQTSTTNVRTSTATKQIHAATTQKSATTKLLLAVNVQVPTTTTTTEKPATAKLLPTANAQTPTAIEQMHTATAQAPAVVKNQQLGKYFSKLGYQVDHLEPSECSHNGIDCHHPSEDLGVDVITSKITGKICEYVVYEGVYCYGLSGMGKNQREPGVQIGGVELCYLLVKVLTSWIIEWPM
ncbi:hypothetical protein DSO57_1030966 [Entomophthora muscae]|uniref:Uncharacterized protein n=1 Tax=Entomophthora muscae TaxID=34485 RepID=A0ACC2UM25_9FUNG|nr:hypothetical protein DSO57_1030966 [Entomophthora muscae]